MGIRFGECELTVERLELRRADQVVAIEPQVFDVLTYLLRHRERVVPKTELLDEVWGNRFVSESALTSRIKSARRAVGDTGREQRIIKTIHGRGYRFVADVVEIPARTTATPDDGSPAHRVLQVVADVAAGRGAAIQIVGGAGAGKTDLLHQLAETAQSHALAIGLSAPSPAESSPYACIAEALDEMVQRCPGLLDAIPAGCRTELQRAFEGRLPTTRQRWYVAVRELLVAAAEQLGVLLLLDDLQLAHHEALALVDDLARLTRRHRVAVVVASARRGYGGPGSMWSTWGRAIAVRLIGSRAAPCLPRSMKPYGGWRCSGTGSTGSSSWPPAVVRRTRPINCLTSWCDQGSSAPNPAGTGSPIRPWSPGWQRRSCRYDDRLL